MSDRIWNLQLLAEGENRGRGNEPFAEWLESQNESYFDKHLIPTDEDLYTIERFPDFIEQREELIIDSLIDRFGPTETRSADD
jgi:hypothetical protein